MITRDSSYISFTRKDNLPRNMEHIEQENVTDLGDSDFGLEENPSSDNFFVRQTKKRAGTSKDTVKKKRKSSKSTTNTLAETLSTENIPEENNNQVTSNASSETGLSTNQQPSKPDLKRLQLVPINKVPGNSWIWSYYRLYKPVQPYKRIVSCLVEVNKNNRTYQCGHLMGSTDSSTGNFIAHLVSRHAIMEESHKQKLRQQQSIQPKLDQMFQGLVANDPKRKARRDQKFVSMLVKDQLPINLREGVGFSEFLEEFDPNYQLPSEKHCRTLLTDGFLYSKESLKKMLYDNIIFCSLTCDLWTGRDRMGYFGVTCSFIDNNFQLNELVLTIKYLPYPHNGESIAEALNLIIDEWRLTNKVFTITTDNTAKQL